MKAEELMVKDWVQDKKYGYCYQIESLWALVNVEGFKPIPITPEILEKNGFIYDEEKDLLTCWVGNSFIDCDTNTGYFMIVRKGKSYEGVINYVHELQHVLRLCKIDKEIIL